MKRLLLLSALFCLLLCAASAVYADELMPNPSLYSAADVAFRMPDYWIANYIEVLELMKNYPDFQCTHSSNPINGENFDQIICNSVNNKQARDIIINFYFTGDHAGMTGLRQAVFSVSTPEPADFQEVLEQFWNPENYPWHTENDRFYGTMTSMVFYSMKTVQRFDLPDFKKDGDKFTTVDLWDSNQGRMAVG